MFANLNLIYCFIRVYTQTEPLEHVHGCSTNVPTTTTNVLTTVPISTKVLANVAKTAIVLTISPTSTNVPTSACVSTSTNVLRSSLQIVQRPRLSFHNSLITTALNWVIIFSIAGAKRGGWLRSSQEELMCV